MFQGSLAVAIILIDGSENPIVSWALNFRVRMLLKTTITYLNTERAYKKAPSSTLLASILKSRVRVTVMKEKSSANFAF